MAYASKREILAWSMYDFANSAFTTTITTVVFSVYLSAAVVPAEGVPLLGMTLKGPTVWALAYGLSLGIAAAIAPLVGAVSDYSASKKRYLTFFWLLGCVATLGLWFVGKGDWLLGAALYAIGNIAFESSVSLNSAFLPELAPAEKLDRISSVGWGIGYIGGGLCLVMNLFLITKHDVVGLTEDQGLRAALASVGLWWFLFGIPCILGVKERSTARPLPAGRSLWSAGFLRAFETSRNLRRFKTLGVLTLSVLLFTAGVNTVLTMSGPFAENVLGFKKEELIQCFLMIQGVGAVGALLAAVFASRVPTKISLYVLLAVWIAALAWAYLMKTKTEFWWLGVVIGLIMGGTQSLSRGLQARLTPPSATAEFFGFYGVTQKMAAAAASILYALTSAIGPRSAIASIVLLFLAGLWLLHPVNVDHGRQEADEEEKRLQAERAA